MLGCAIGEFERIFKTKHNLTFINVLTYSHKILTQLNRVISRNSMERKVIYSKKGDKQVILKYNGDKGVKHLPKIS